jgi:hypothetical protein
MKALKELFLKHQVETSRLKKAMSERRVKSTATSKHKMRLIKSQAVALQPNALDIRSLIDDCKMLDDYLFITFLFHQTGYKKHMQVVYDTLFTKLDRSSDLILIGKQMMAYGFSGAYEFFSKASSCASNVYDKILVQETYESFSTGYNNVA